MSFRGKNWNLSPIPKGQLNEFNEWRKNADAIKVGDRFWVRSPGSDEYVAGHPQAQTAVQALRCRFVGECLKE